MIALTLNTNTRLASIHVIHSVLVISAGQMIRGDDCLLLHAVFMEDRVSTNDRPLIIFLME